MKTALRIPLLLCLLALLLVACSGSGGSGGSTTQTTPALKPTATATQPVSAQAILSMPVTYVAIGASDAVGVGTSKPATQGYVPLLAARLPKGSHVLNLGVSGIRIHQALTQELPLALNTAPNLITIWLAANDFDSNIPYDSYIQDLNSLLQQLRAGTKARIVMANLPDLTLLPAFASQSASQKAQTVVRIKQWNAGIAATAAKYQVTLVDLFSHDSQITAHPDYISGDGFHPSAAGYVQLSNYFWDAIKS